MHHTSTGLLTPVGEWIARLRYEDIPADTLRAARYQVANMIAAVHAAAPLDDARAVARAVTRFAGAGRATVLATGARVTPCEAAQANAAYSMAQDFDDIIWMGHTCHSAVFAPLAVAEHEDKDVRDLLVAVVAANEVGGRLGASSFLGPLNGQMWTFIHLVGAAAATAKLLGLDAARTTHALAISLAQPTFALQPAFMAASSKLLSASTPTAIGIQAAYFAREGLQGEATILEDARGFWRRFAFKPMPGMLGELGHFWATQTLAIKTYPGCHFFQTALSALERLRARLPELRVDQIEKVHIDTTKLGAEVTRFGQEYGRARPDEIGHVNVNFDLATTAAVFLTAGRLTGHEMEPAWLDAHTPELNALRRKVTVEHDPALTLQVIASARALPTGREALAGFGVGDLFDLRESYKREYASTLVSGKEALRWAKTLITKRSILDVATTESSALPLRFPNRVTLYLTNGTRESEQVDLPVASFCRPEMEPELQAKFVREVGAQLGEDPARRAFETLLDLEGSGLASAVAQVTLAR